MSTLFGLDRPGALTGLRTLVAFERYPFFSLGGRASPIIHDGVDHGRCFRLTVAATEPAHGLPTLTDAYVLIYVTTRLTEFLNAREPLPDVINLLPIDFLRALGRPLGGGQYAQLDAAIARLHHCSVATDLFAGAGALTTFIDNVDPPTGRRKAYRLHLPEFLLAQVAAKQILSFDPAAQRLHGLERRVYGWGLANVGGNTHQPRPIPLGEAYKRAGIALADPSRLKTSLRQFKAALTRVATANRLPGFHLKLVTEGKRTSLLLTRSPDAPTCAQPQRAEEAGPNLSPSLANFPAPTAEHDAGPDDFAWDLDD